MDQYADGIPEDADRPDLLPIQEFVSKVGGLERAKFALDTLEELRYAA